MTGQMGIAAANAQVAHVVAQLPGPLVLPLPAAAVEPFDDPHVVKGFPLLNVLGQADAEAAGMGGDGVGIVLAGGLEQFPGVHGYV